MMVIMCNHYTADLTEIQAKCLNVKDVKASKSYF